MTICRLDLFHSNATFLSPNDGFYYTFLSLEHVTRFSNCLLFRGVFGIHNAVCISYTPPTQTYPLLLLNGNLLNLQLFVEMILTKVILSKYFLALRLFMKSLLEYSRFKSCHFEIFRHSVQIILVKSFNL